MAVPGPAAVDGDSYFRVRESFPGMTLLQNLLVGAYIGILTGVFTALLVFGLTFAFMYFAGVKFPVIYAMLIALGGAGLQGGIRVFIRNPDLLASATGVVAFLIVMMMALYAHDRGQKLGEALPPKRTLFRGLQKRALSPEVVRQIGRFGQVRIRTTGEVADMEGYLPLPDDVRTAIRNGEWTFPGDLPVHELERRLSETLVTEYDLEDVTVRIDQRGRATVTAAPPSGSLSRRVPSGKQVVAMDTVVPAGIAEGDEVKADVSGAPVVGRVISAATDAADGDAEPEPDDGDGDLGEDGTPIPVPTGATGGSGRLAVAVDPDDVSTVVENDVSRLVVRSRGTNREYELVSLLRRDNNGFEKLSLRTGSELVDASIGTVGFREAYGVAVLAIKRADEWFFAPDGQTSLQAGDELFVTGRKDGLETLRGLVA